MPQTCEPMSQTQPASDTPTGQGRRHFAMLDAMRGTAALGVVCLHLHALLAPISAPHGYLAVDFFFGLSGLVISRAYVARLAQGLSTWQFMRLRLERLYPLYILGTAIGGIALFLPIALHPSLAPPLPTLASTLLSSLFMLPSPLSSGEKLWLMPMNIAAWSLVLELLVNLLFALAWRKLTIPVLAVVISGSAIILALLVLREGSIDLGATWPTLPAGLVRTVFSFFCGVAIGRLSFAAPRTNIWSPLLPLALFATLVPDQRFGATYDLLCTFAVYPTLLYLGARYESAHVSALRFLGSISYPLYALHSGVVFLAGGLALKWAGRSDVARLAFGFAMLFGLVLLAAVAEAKFDRPLRDQLVRWRKAKSRAAKQTATQRVTPSLHNP